MRDLELEDDIVIAIAVLVGFTGPDVVVDVSGCRRCRVCFTSLSWWSLTGLIALVLVMLTCGIVFMVRRAGGKRSQTVGIVRILINYVQANSSMGSFSTRAPGETCRLSSPAPPSPPQALSCRGTSRQRRRSLYCSHDGVSADANFTLC